MVGRSCLVSCFATPPEHVLLFEWPAALPEASSSSPLIHKLFEMSEMEEGLDSAGPDSLPTKKFDVNPHQPACCHQGNQVAGVWSHESGNNVVSTLW